MKRFFMTIALCLACAASFLVMASYDEMSNGWHFSTSDNKNGGYVYSEMIDDVEMEFIIVIQYPDYIQKDTVCMFNICFKDKDGEKVKYTIFGNAIDTYYYQTNILGNTIIVFNSTDDFEYNTKWEYTDVYGKSNLDKPSIRWCYSILKALLQGKGVTFTSTKGLEKYQTPSSFTLPPIIKK